MRNAHPHHPRGWDGHGGHHRGHRDHPALGRPPGPQTFRRARALQFLEFLNVRRATLMRQLEQPEFQDLRPTILGELKAVETVRDEFVALFDLWPDERGPSSPADERWGEQADERRKGPDGTSREAALGEEPPNETRGPEDPGAGGKDGD